MPIELARDPVLTDDELRDCIAETPFDANSRSAYLVQLGRAIEQKVLARQAERRTHIASAPDYGTACERATGY